MSASPEAFFADLLDALERHTQAVQGNTAAINSFLGRQVFAGDALTRTAISAQIDALCAAAANQIANAKTIIDRLELLRRSITEEAISESTGPETNTTG